MIRQNLLLFYFTNCQVISLISLFHYIYL